MKFESLSLCEPLIRSLQAAGYHEATLIQQQAIPQALQGRDLVGCAQTGTGKTAAYALPTIQILMKSLGTPTAAPTGKAPRQRHADGRTIRSLILAPTRELAGQIGESLATYGRFTGLRFAVVFGGVRQGPQVRAIQAGIDILVATPGRLLDLVGQGWVELASVEILILDEADRMLDMGFIHDLRKIVAKIPRRRQTLMFSATMPQEIRGLAGEWLRQPFEVQVAAIASTPELVSQSVCFVERHDKPATLIRFLQESHRSKTLVFSRTKRGADKIARFLQHSGIRASAIHGDKSQSKRTSVIREFNSKRPPVLVATDLAARGLDFSDVSHVINYDLPEDPETYVHRIGRTARAGASGQAVSFCGNGERQRLRMIEKLTGKSVPVVKLPGTSAGQRARAIKLPVDQSEAVAANSNDIGGQGAGRGDKQHSSKPRARRNARPRRRTASGSAIGSSRRRFTKASGSRRKTKQRVVVAR